MPERKELMSEETFERVDKIVSGKSFDELSEEDMLEITGAVKEIHDVNPEITPAIIAATASVCVSAVGGIVSYKKKCI